MTAAAELRYLPVARIAALHLWDDRAWDALARRHVRLAREAGALSDLPLALSSLACLRLLAGDPGTAESLAEDARLAAETTGVALPPYAALQLAALSGRLETARTLIGGAEREATLRGEGLGVAAANWLGPHDLRDRGVDAAPVRRRDLDRRPHRAAAARPAWRSPCGRRGAFWSAVIRRFSAVAMSSVAAIALSGLFLCWPSTSTAPGGCSPPCTVGWHLRKVFAKIGLTSRTLLLLALPSAA